MIARALITGALGTLLLAQTPPGSPAAIVESIFAPVTGTPTRPSAAIAYVAGASTPEFAFFGTTGFRTLEHPNPRTTYEIGSITKGLTGLLLADMATAGEVSVHDPVDKFLPDGAYPDAIRRITLVQLATHSSGLPRLPGDLSVGMTDPSNPYVHYGEERLLAFLRGYREMPRGTAITPTYSNLGFGLLGYALARRAGIPYEALLKARVLDPLGMRDTSVALSADQQARLARGHAGGALVSNWDIGALGGAGAVRSTAADMAKLLTALMHPPAGRIGKAIAIALEPRGDLGAARIGFGWITTTPPAGTPFVWHNGGTGGYRAFIGFMKDRRAGIVVLTNGADEGPDALALQALRRLAGS